MPELSVAERRQEILTRVNQGGRAAVGDLSREFGVSEVTIRGDLQALADGGLVLRTHGGAIPATAGLQFLSLGLRRQQQVQEKAHIGAAAADLVADGDAIILDSSSTALAIAQILKSRRYLTVITNGLAIAQELLDCARRDRGGASAGCCAATPRRWSAPTGWRWCAGSTSRRASSARTASPWPKGSPTSAPTRRTSSGRWWPCAGEVVAVLDATKWGRVGRGLVRRPCADCTQSSPTPTPRPRWWPPSAPRGCR